MTYLQYEGAAFLRQRLLLSTLTGQPVRISNIRATASALSMPGLRPYEASLLRLLCKVTVGSSVHVDTTGTVLTYVPGQLLGNDDESPDRLTHACHASRGISYYLEVLLLLAPFCKNPLSITLTGVTDGAPADLSVDLTRSVTVPTLQHLLVLVSNRGGGGGAPALTFDVKLVRRGFPPAGGGEVSVQCSGVLAGALQPFALVETGRVKRVRGVAFAENMSPLLARRCINRIRHVFNAFLPDVWVYLDVKKKAKNGKSVEQPTAAAAENKARRGMGVALVAETIKGNVKGAAAFAHSQASEEDEKRNDQDAAAADAYRATGNCKLAKLLEAEAKELQRKGSAGDANAAASSEAGNELGGSEQMGDDVAHRLLLEIMQGGVVDTNHQYMALLFAAAADEHQPSKLRLSRLTPYTTQFLRHLRDFLGVTFHFEEKADSETPEVLLKCVGVGLRNTARKTF
ncbi:18S rRNA biogenesis protein RCL1 protein [Besnoitia besnoiti]|uniref:18S rRNA biogenesis protein RCL1 protein n=1 Tax=Besnoitia besnoiti TaxID=94643 RepID=A0A2A9MQK7_BESBE|nr:18S rRNA biogenesis protein RCL1 protein [Besnoitia besnoiti]PFH38573.1 18S rRNA biogenesis protein RCL1 protein [Besnoitia besnoiti]